MIEFIVRDGTKAYVVKSTIQADGGHCIVVYSEREETCRRLAGALTQPFCEFIAGLAPNAAKSRQALEGVGYEDQRTRIQGYTRAQWEAWEQRKGSATGDLIANTSTTGLALLGKTPKTRGSSSMRGSFACGGCTSWSTSTPQQDVG